MIHFCVSHICINYFRTLYIWYGKRVFSGECTAGCCFFCSVIHRLCCCMYFRILVILFWSTTLHYICYNCWTCVQEEPYLPHSNLQFFPSLFFVMYPQNFLSRRESPLVYPHRRTLLSLAMENMCLATTFMRGEEYERKDGSEISSSSFPSDDFRTWPQAHLDVLLSTACIVLSLSLTMISMIKSYNIMHPIPSS